MSSVTTTYTNESLSPINDDINALQTTAQHKKLQLSNKKSKQFNFKLGPYRKSNKNILSIGENYLATLMNSSIKPTKKSANTLTTATSTNNDMQPTTNLVDDDALEQSDSTNDATNTITTNNNKLQNDNNNQQISSKLFGFTKLHHLTQSISNVTLKSYSNTPATGTTTTTGKNNQSQSSSSAQLKESSDVQTTTNGKSSSKNVSYLASSSVSSSSAVSTVPAVCHVSGSSINQQTTKEATSGRSAKYEKSLSTSTGADNLSVIEEKLDDEQHPSLTTSGSAQEASKTSTALDPTNTTTTSSSKHRTVSRGKEVDISDEDLSGDSSASEESSTSSSSQSSSTMSRQLPSSSNVKSNISGSSSSPKHKQQTQSSSFNKQQNKSMNEGAVPCLRSESSSSSPQAASSLKNSNAPTNNSRLVSHRGSLHKSDSDLSLSIMQNQTSSIDDSTTKLNMTNNKSNTSASSDQPRYLQQSRSPNPPTPQATQNNQHHKYQQQASHSSLKLRQPAYQFAQSVSTVKTQQHLLQQMIKQQNLSLGLCKANDNRNIFIHPNRIQQAEYPFVTIKKYPDGMIQSIGGVVSVHSVKLLHIINDVESEKRDTWWTEIRKEIKSHAKSLNCNTILGYRETSRIREDVCILSASGTAAILKPTPIICPQDFANAATIQSDVSQMKKLDNDLMGGKLDSAFINSQQQSVKTDQQQKQQTTNSPMQNPPARPDCSLCHTPLTCLNSVSSFADCTLCHKNKVPDVLLLTIEPPSNLNTASIGTLVQARVCRNKRDSHGEVSAKEVDDALPFLEYELHRQLLSKLKFMGMNCLYGLTVDISVGENMLTGVATGTGCFVLGLPAPDPPQISAGKGIKASKLSEIQRIISVSAIKNREHYGLSRFNHNIIPTVDNNQPNSASLLMGATTHNVSAANTTSSISTSSPHSIPATSSSKKLTEQSTSNDNSSTIIRQSLRASSSTTKPDGSEQVASSDSQQNSKTTTGSEFRSLDRSLSSANYHQHSSSASPPPNEQSSAGAHLNLKQSSSQESGSNQQQQQQTVNPTASIHQNITQVASGGSSALNNTIVLEVDDNEDADIIALMIDSEVPYGYFVCNSETYPSLQPTSISSINMFTQVMRAKLTGIKQFAQQFDWIIQSLFVKLRRSLPCCLTNIKFVVDLPEADIVQIAVTGCLIGLQQPASVQQQNQAKSMSNDPNQTNDSFCQPTTSQINTSKQQQHSNVNEPNAAGGSKNNQMSSSSLSPSTPSSTSASSNSLSTTTSSSTTTSTTSSSSSSTSTSSSTNSQLNSTTESTNEAKKAPQSEQNDTKSTETAKSKSFSKKKQALVKAGQELRLKLSELSTNKSSSTSSNANDNKDTSPDSSDPTHNAPGNRLRNNQDNLTKSATSPTRTVYKKQSTYPGAIAPIVDGQEPLEHRIKLAQQATTGSKYSFKKFQQNNQRQQQVTTNGSPTLKSVNSTTKSPTTKKVASDRDTTTTTQVPETNKNKKKSSSNYQRQTNNPTSTAATASTSNTHPTGSSSGNGKRRSSVQFGPNGSNKATTNGVSGGGSGNAHETSNSNIDITSLSYIPGATDYHYLGNLSFSFVRETNSVRENGGLNGFIHCFLMEVYAIVRAHVSALGGNAFLSFRLQQFCVIYHSNKNQAQCLISVAGDAAHISHQLM